MVIIQLSFDTGFLDLPFLKFLVLLHDSSMGRVVGVYKHCLLSSCDLQATLENQSCD